MSADMVHIPPVAWAGAAIGAIRLLTPTRAIRRGGAPAATALAGASALLGIAAIREFRRHDTTVDPAHPELASTLVTTGPYRFTRNPMYLALVGGLTAYGVWRGRAAGLIPVTGFVVALTRFQIAGEEAFLAVRYPDDFAAFAASTPRWLTAAKDGLGTGRNRQSRRHGLSDGVEEQG